MRNKERCWIPAFFVICISLLTALAGCGQHTSYQFEPADETEAAEAGAAQEEQKDPDAAEDGAAQADDPVPEEPEMIWVYVCGAVRVPGVYQLPAEGRVYQALDAAGGVTENAELRSLNQAALLKDGEQITVYTVQEIENAGGMQAPNPGLQNGSAGSGKININTAGQEELMKLSGIGEVRAQAIIKYREENGPFTAIEEIMNIEGIKEKSFSKIKDEIEV